MPPRFSIEIPETTPAVYRDFLKYLMEEHPLTHPNTDCTFVMKHTKTVDGRPGSFFGSRPFGRNYSRIMVALGRPERPHPVTSVLHSIAHEYKHLLQHELEADLFALREVFRHTGDPRTVKQGIEECYKGTQNFLAANPEVKAGLTML